MKVSATSDELGQVRAHGGGAERAVEADGEGAGVAHRMPEGGRRLAGQRAAREIGDRAGDHDRQARCPSRAKISSQAKIAALAFKRVEDRLEQDDVGAAVDQPAQLLAIGDPRDRRR